MNSKRVFANEKDINYTKNKMGIEILKNMKSKHKDPAYFFSYDRFILLTKTYFNHLKKGSIEILVPTNIYNSNTSFICYQSLLSHMKDCEHCNDSKDKDIFYLHKCKDLQGILYPYGQYIAENIPNGIYLHNRFTLDDWCYPFHSTLFPLKEESDDEDLILPQIYNKKNDCSACSNNELKEKREKKEKEKNANKNQNTHVFPSQNLFVFENKKEKVANEYENKQRMNAYSVYPSIKNGYKEENNKYIEEEKYPCQKTSTSLCKNMKPLFI